MREQDAGSQAETVAVGSFREHGQGAWVLGQEDDRREATPGHEQVGRAPESLHDFPVELRDVGVAETGEQRAERVLVVVFDDEAWWI